MKNLARIVLLAGLWCCTSAAVGSGSSPLVGCPPPGGATSRATRSGDPELAAQLVYAVTQHDKAAVCKALEAGADPNLKVDSSPGRRAWYLRGGPTPAVVAAAWEKDPWFMETLLLHGGDPNADHGGKDELNGSVFVGALFRRNEHLVPLLIKHGLDLNKPLAGGTTVLDESVTTGSYPVGILLLNAGALPEQGKDKGKFFFDILCVDSCLNQEAWAKRDALAKELRARGYKFKCVWEGQQHCAPSTRSPWGPMPPK